LSAIPNAFNTCIYQSGISLEDCFLFLFFFFIFVAAFITSSGIHLISRPYSLGLLRNCLWKCIGEKGKTVLLTAQNLTVKYIQLRASCNFACTYLNLNEDLAVYNFTMLQNVTLFRPWGVLLGDMSGLWLCGALNAIHGDQW